MGNTLILKHRPFKFSTVFTSCLSCCVHSSQQFNISGKYISPSRYFPLRFFISIVKISCIVFFSCTTGFHRWLVVIFIPVDYNCVISKFNCIILLKIVERKRVFSNLNSSFSSNFFLKTLKFQALLDWIINVIQKVWIMSYYYTEE